MIHLGRLSSRLLITLFAWLTAGAAWAAPGAGYEPYVAPDAAAGPSASLFVVLAYSSIWLVVLLFVLSVWRRQRQVEAELRELQARLVGARPGGAE